MQLDVWHVHGFNITGSASYKALLAVSFDKPSLVHAVSGRIMS
jgi:hypothetical protein